MATIYPDGTIEGMPGLINESGMSDDELAQFILEHLDELKLGMENEQFKDAIAGAFEEAANAQFEQIETFVEEFDILKVEYFGVVLVHLLFGLVAWRTRASLFVQSMLSLFTAMVVFFTSEISEFFLSLFCSSALDNIDSDAACELSAGMGMYIPIMVSTPLAILGFLIALNVIIRGGFRLCSKKPSSSENPKPLDGDDTSQKTEIEKKNE